MDYCYCDVIEKIFDHEILIILEVMNDRKKRKSTNENYDYFSSRVMKPRNP